jgi:hypothetical protein
MPLTRDFKQTFQGRTGQDSRFRHEVLRQAVESLLVGDLEMSKALLRDFVNATIGFERLRQRTKRPAKSLMRMLGPKANPRASSLLDVVAYLLRAEGLRFELLVNASAV